MVNGEKLGDVGFQYLGVPYSQMDCQAFVEQCLRDCGLDMNLAGSNAWFREVYKNGQVMTPEDCVKRYGKVPKGAFLFILKNDGGEPAKYKPDGLGNASHIGLVTMPRGEGAIHSSSSRGMVCESKFAGKTIRNGGWNRVGLWNRVEYSTGTPDIPDDPVAPDEPDTQKLPTLRKGSRGDAVTFLQTRLIQMGYDLPLYGADGDFGKETEDAVKGFQMNYNYNHPENQMPVDGIVGPRTWDAIMNEANVLYTVTIHHIGYDVANEIIRRYGGSMTAEKG